MLHSLKVLDETFGSTGYRGIVLNIFFAHVPFNGS